MRKQNRQTEIVAFINRYRIHLLLLLVFLVMALFAPRFLNVFNMTVIMKSASLNAMAAIGFTIVLICGHLDLSVSSTISLGAILVIGLRPDLGWSLGLIGAVAAGAAVGVVNGLLVAKAKIHSFIVTIGTLTIVQGLIYVYTGGAALNVTGAADFALADLLEDPVLLFLTPRVIITILVITGFEIFFMRTRPGRNFYMVGGNRETAWLAGVNADAYVIGAFVISGSAAALSGALFAIGISSATTDLGVNSLMIIVAATIIGGTSMNGGKGHVLYSGVAVLMLTVLFNGLNRFGVGSEFRILASGLILASVVLYEAYSNYKSDRIRGQRPELMKELDEQQLKTVASSLKSREL
jgi:ribose/xylose/arabinose/galactoside ABC-type transport system permease subunit